MVAPPGQRSSISREKSRPRSTGVTRCGGLATPLSPPPPGPLPPAPLPVPVPTPPAPVPGPRTSDAPWVGAVPCRGVSLAAIFCTGGVSIFGLGATTGVASLLIFLGADPPSFSFGLGRCFWVGGGGGGGGGWPTSNVLSTLCGSPRSILPEICSSANSSAACTAITAAIAPPLSRLLRSLRYIRLRSTHL